MPAPISLPRTRSPVSIRKRVVAALALCALAASGCGSAKHARSPAAEARMASGDTAAPPPAGPAVGATVATGATGEQAETWRRSQIAANTARVMVGDREELPLRGLQAQVIKTQLGGRLTQDVTRGYGPEMYVLPRAPRGRFAIRAHYYARDRNRASARTKVYATITENWGTPAERTTEKVLALTDGREWHDIATLVAR